MQQVKPRTKTPPIDLGTIHGVVRTGDFERLKHYVQENGTDVVHQLDPNGYSVMHWAVYEGSLESAKYLIELGASLTETKANKPQHSPLHWACVKGRIEMVRLLLESGVDINVQDNKGYTGLITACQHGDVALAAYLISRGAKLEAEDTNGDNALHWAVYKGHPDVTRLLIVYGMNPKKIDKYGQSILHLACLSGNLNIVQQLIEQDCIDTEIRDNNGRKAIDLARTRSYGSIVDYIDRHSKNRKMNNCNLKSWLFGPVGNSRGVFIAIHVLYFFYEYPAYFLQVMPETFHDLFWWHASGFLTTLVMWLSFYMVHITDPGYLKKDTDDYQTTLRRLTFKSQTMNPADWNRSLARLCHTCRTVKPYRASHCRACNRCVLAYDHHCPYVQTCIGYNNRPWFFVFVLSTSVLQFISMYILYHVMEKDWYQYVYYPGIPMLGLAFFLSTVLVGSAIYSAVLNMTGNELMKREKYDYLKDYKGKGRNLFDQGWIYNIKYYFHLVEPSYLERPGFDMHPNYSV